MDILLHKHKLLKSCTVLVNVFVDLLLHKYMLLRSCTCRVIVNVTIDILLHKHMLLRSCGVIVNVFVDVLLHKHVTKELWSYCQCHCGCPAPQTHVSCHLPSWWNDRDLLHATVVTQGWNGYRNKSQHRKLTLDKKILPLLLKPVTC